MSIEEKHKEIKLAYKIYTSGKYKNGSNLSCGGYSLIGILCELLKTKLNIPQKEKHIWGINNYISWTPIEILDYFKLGRSTTELFNIENQHGAEFLKNYLLERVK
jgi:hypothetical protein